MGLPARERVKQGYFNSYRFGEFRGLLHYYKEFAQERKSTVPSRPFGPFVWIARCSEFPMDRYSLAELPPGGNATSQTDSITDPILASVGIFSYLLSTIALAIVFVSYLKFSKLRTSHNRIVISLCVATLLGCLVRRRASRTAPTLAALTSSPGRARSCT